MGFLKLLKCSIKLLYAHFKKHISNFPNLMKGMFYF